MIEMIGLIYKSEAEDAQQSLIQQRMQEQQENLPESTLPVAPGIEDVQEMPVEEPQEAEN